jgi:hypothetical protein
MFKKMQYDALLCPGCGFGFWHNWGVLDALQFDGKFIAFSGSALAAVCHLCKLNVDEQIRICNSMRGTILTDLQQTLRRWLSQSLPRDCTSRCNGRIEILARDFATLRLHSWTEWNDKDHLIDTLVASCSPIFPVVVGLRSYIDCYVYPSLRTRIPSKSVFRVPTADGARALYDEGFAKGQKFKKTLG